MSDTQTHRQTVARLTAVCIQTPNGCNCTPRREEQKRKLKQAAEEYTLALKNGASSTPPAAAKGHG